MVTTIKDYDGNPIFLVTSDVVYLEVVAAVNATTLFNSLTMESSLASSTRIARGASIR